MRPHIACANGNVGGHQSDLRRRHQISDGIRLYSALLRKTSKRVFKGRVVICTVIGFPNGYNTTAVKEFETKDAIANGADEIDMVINIGELKAGNYDYVENEIRTLKKACGDKILKVIIETCLLTDDEKSRCANSSPKRARISSRPPRASRKRAQRLRISSFLQSTWAKTSE